MICSHRQIRPGSADPYKRERISFMKIRQADERDIARMMEIYAYAREQMVKTGNPNQWGPTNWPPEEVLRRDMEEGRSYVCENDAGTVIGTFCYLYGKDIDATYRNITDGAWMDDSPYGVVHRLAGDGSEKGIGAFCIKWAFDQCGHMRVDTHGDNKLMQHLLKKLGFVHCGTIHVEEDDYPRLAFEKTKIPRLTDELVEAEAGKAFEEFRRIGKQYWRGFLDETMARQEMRSGFSRIFMKLFRDHHLDLRLNRDSYPLFKEEYEACRKGMPFSNHMPWLFDTEEDYEASERDQARFFDLMTRFHVSPDCFEPLPEEAAEPGIVPIHQYKLAGVYGIHFDVADDGGLLEEARPIGKTFRLKSRKGLEAVLTIREDRRQQDRSGMDFDELVVPTEHGLSVSMAEFLAEGYIEGYTARERTADPRILIRLEERGTRVSWLAFWSDPKDQEAFRNDPLWQDYFIWQEEKSRRLHAALSGLLEEVKEQTK